LTKRSHYIINKIKYCFILVLAFLWTNLSFAQSDGGTLWWNTNYNTTEGTDFWVTFLRNAGKGKNDKDFFLRFFATSRQKNDVTVYYNSDTLATFWDEIGMKQFHINANQMAGLSNENAIPNPYAYVEDESDKLMGLHVRSKYPISLYALNYYQNSYDATMVAPLSALGREYVIQTFVEDNSATEFVIVAIEDGTEIEITPRENNVELTPIQITLHRGNTYIYRSKKASIDLSGTHICASAPIAVFQGGQDAYVPKGNSNGPANHLYEQVYSTDLWGKQFIVSRTANQDNDYIRITTAYSGTKIKINGVEIKTLNKFETYSKLINWSEYTEDAIVIETSHGALCGLYLTSSNSNKTTGIGAPTYVNLPPIEYGVNSSITSSFTFDNKYSQYHYINIALPSSAISGMILDNKVVPSSEFTKLGYKIKNVEYSTARVKVSTGSHTLQNTKGIFTTHIYGIGQYKQQMEDGSVSEFNESYAYAGGFRINHAADMKINDAFIRQKTICINQSLKFEAVINFEYDSLRWEFGDNQSSKSMIVPAVKWSEPSTYDVALIISSHTPNCKFLLKDTVMARIIVTNEYNFNTSEKLCVGETYTISGLDENGNKSTKTFTQDTKQDLVFKTAAGCDSIVHLDLKFGKPDPKVLVKKACSFYYWEGVKYTQSGVYTHSRANDYGCETTDTLKLTISYPVTGPVIDKTICSGDLPYEWGGDKYFESGVYYDTLRAANGCDSIVTLDLKIEYAYLQDTTIMVCPGTYVKWRNKEVKEAKTYEEHAQTAAGCDSTFILHLINYPTYNEASNQTICEGENYQFGDTILKTSGIYKRKLQSQFGCDSIVELTLTVIPTEMKILYDTICANETYMFDGKAINKVLPKIELVGKDVDRKIDKT